MPSAVGANAKTISDLDALVGLAEQIRSGGDEGAAKQAEKVLLRAADLRKELERRYPTPKVAAAQAAGREKAAEQDAARAARARLEAIAQSSRERDTRATRTFEYSVVELQPEDAASRLNEAGSLGWELLNVLPSGNGCERFFFRREVWAEVDASGARAFAPGTRSVAPAAAAAGGGFVAFGYAESGPDLDADGDVDGGLLDSLGDLFG